MRNLIKFQKYITETCSNAFNAYQLLHLCAEDEKADQGIVKGLLSKALARSMYPIFNQDSEIFFEVGSDLKAFVREMTDNQSSFGMTDEGLNYEELGVSETFITFLTYHQRVKKQNIKYLHQSN